MSKQIPQFGWRPDSLDHRDQKYKLGRFSLGRPLPAMVDLSAGFPPPYDQGALGSCVGNGVAAVMQFQRRKQKLQDFTPSRLYIYYYARVAEGTPMEDAGAEIRDGIKVVASRGAPDEALWPYDINQFAVAPPAAAEAAAVADVAVSYESLDNTDPLVMKDALAFAGNPVVFGCTVFQQFMNIGADGLVTMPAADDQPIGGHCMVIAGYRDVDRTYLVRNSWDARWGLNGWCRMPYDYIHSPALCSDAWHVSFVQSLGT